jgi:hypothetical protein
MSNDEIVESRFQQEVKQGDGIGPAGNGDQKLWGLLRASYLFLSPAMDWGQHLPDLT